MRLSKRTVAGLTCLLLTFTALCGCTVSPAAPTTTAAPTVPVTEPDETRIGKDAYNGSEIEQFSLGGKVEYIDEGAFANCGQLKNFYCRSRDVSIHDKAFSGSENVVFYCYVDSTVASFAKENGYDCVYYDGFSIQCDTVNNGCAGLPITWSVVDVPAEQRNGSRFVYTVNLNDEPVYASLPTSELSFSYIPTEGGSYTLSVELRNKDIEYTVNSEDLAVADKFMMGLYEQDNDSTALEPLEWRILAVEDGKALVITEHIIDRGSYFNPEWIKFKYTYWAYSCVAATSSTNYWGSAPVAPERLMGGLTADSVPLSWKNNRGPETDLFYLHARYWCNETFYKEVFTEEEKERILLSDLTNHDNPMYGTLGGPDTQDYVFFLSYDELVACLPTNEDRKATFTTYADNLPLEYGERDPYYWLRTPGVYRINAMYVLGEYGMITFYGSDVGHNMVGYRPAMWITIGG